jgi:hypothetical protein
VSRRSGGTSASATITAGTAAMATMPAAPIVASF